MNKDTSSTSGASARQREMQAESESVRVDEITQDDIRCRSVRLLEKKGWRTGDKMSFNGVLQLMSELANSLVRDPPARCAFPDCECDHDAICGNALATRAASMPDAGAEDVERHKHMRGVLGIELFKSDCANDDVSVKIDRLARAALAAMPPRDDRAGLLRAAKNVLWWLDGALACTFGWDRDQHEAATMSANELREALRTPTPEQGEQEGWRPRRWSNAAINEWIETTFGQTGSNISVVGRANEEMAELLQALAVRDDDPKAAEETADIVIILLRLAARMGFDLDAEIDKKMDINAKRQWNVANGHGYHVKSSGASK